MSLNSNNTIVSKNSSEWSQKYRTNKKSGVPLRVINSMGTIELNSNELGDEGTRLNAKNVMIASEDSSEWSQDFLMVNENQTTDQDGSNSGLAEHEDMENTEKDPISVNYTATGDTDELSNFIPESEEREGAVTEQSEELMAGDILRCRTCLSIVNPEEGIPLYTPQPSRETLKDLLIYLLPQMASTLCDEDVVCSQCDTSIKFCVEFIDNCLKVENDLLNEYDEPGVDQEESMESEDKYRPEETTHVTLDHDYMVSKGMLTEFKTESDAFMETEDSEMAENLLSNDNPMEFLFECFRCGQTFESETSLDRHVVSEHGTLKEAHNSPKQGERIYYKCNACEVLFATKASYNSHVETSHPEMGTRSVRQTTYTCKQCSKKFLYLGDLFEHKSKVHGFICTICPERFDTQEELDAHVDTHPDLYSCETCSKTFKTKKMLTSHTKMHHNPGVIICDECGRTFDSEAELNLHLEQEDHTVMKVIKRFTCDICTSTFTDRKRLIKHKQVFHDGVRQYLCTICDKNFSSKTSMDSHYRLKHAEVKPYQCERCGERFARLDYLRRHNSCSSADQCKKFLKGPRRKFRYTKGDGEPIKCKLCGKVFKDVYLLKLHLTTHTNLRRFRCSVCNLTFTTNKNRERHEKIHDDPLSKYRCTVCWKRTQSQEELDSHMTSHEKKYQCHVCHESFARVYLLNYHVSEVHADDEDVEKEKQIVFTEGLKEYLVEY